MDISQSQQNYLTLSLEQNLSHQQIMALELLTAPIIELNSLINREVERNPVLEVDFEEPTGPRDDDAWLDHLLKLQDDRRYVCGSRLHTQEDEERHQHYIDTATYTQGLHDNLQDELQFLDLDPRLRARCDILINSLNDDGYLQVHEADLAMVARCSLDEIRAAITIVQSLTPAGVAARNVRERLMLQLDREGRRDSLAYVLVRDHLDDIGNNLLPKVARAVNHSMADIQEALEEIRQLHPRIHLDHPKPQDFVHEEVTVSEQDGQLHLHIHNDFLPKLRISRYYQELLRDPATPQEVRDYVKEKIRSAAYLINSVLQRQSTIERICRYIVEVQADYFLRGENYLKPMTMAQVSEHAGVHETTVSRTVADKYLRCSYGLLPLRDFFTSGYVTDDGRELSSTVVKKAIEQLIDAEDPEKPWTDGQLADSLSQQGLKVARRTVAKYRESVGIPASSLRRQYCAV